MLTLKFARQVHGLKRFPMFFVNACGTEVAAKSLKCFVCTFPERSRLCWTGKMRTSVCTSARVPSKEVFRCSKGSAERTSVPGDGIGRPSRSVVTRSGGYRYHALRLSPRADNGVAHTCRADRPAGFYARPKRVGRETCT